MGERLEQGASCGPGSREPSPDGLGPSGFDPSRDELLPDAYSVIRHSRWGAEFRPDVARCRAGVTRKVGRGYDRQQCKNAVKVEHWIDGPKGPEKIGFCSSHDPVKVAERNHRRSEQWKTEYAARVRYHNEEMRVKGSQPEYERILLEIAQGHPNPIAAAENVLAKWKAWSRDSDGSGEAGETQRGSTEGDSAGRDSAGRDSGIAQEPSS